MGEGLQNKGTYIAYSVTENTVKAYTLIRVDPIFNEICVNESEALRDRLLCNMLDCWVVFLLIGQLMQK